MAEERGLLRLRGVLTMTRHGIPNEDMLDARRAFLAKAVQAVCRDHGRKYHPKTRERPICSRMRGSLGFGLLDVRMRDLRAGEGSCIPQHFCRWGQSWTDVSSSS